MYVHPDLVLELGKTATPGGITIGRRTKRPVYVICATGNRSLSAAQVHEARGINAWSVAGGTKGWQVSGRPVVTGARSI